MAVGLDISYEEDDQSPSLKLFLALVNLETLVVFTLEAIIKIVAEGTQPWLYFTDPDGEPR